MRPIHHTFGPLADDQQCRRALAITYTPWKYKHGNSTTVLCRALSEEFNAETFLFASGRQALLAILLAMELNAEDEVIVQAYTCVVVPNAIHAAGGTPVYCDIDRDTLNLDLEALKKCITKKTRAIICQHTFGIPADTKAIRALCDQHKILMIEDCAHILPDTTGPSEIGRWGDVLFTSFGRDKAISGVTGGALILRKMLPTDVHKRLQQLVRGRSPLHWFRIQQLIHYPLVYRRALPLFPLKLGKLYLHLQKKLGNLVPIVTREEKNGSMPTTLHEMPNACAYFAIAQWRKLKEINNHRRTLTAFYIEECEKRGWLEKGSPLYVPRAVTSDLPLQKFPLFVTNASEIRRRLKKQDIYLDDGWATCVICPVSADADAAGYKRGSDPEAEEACMSILSLPTHPQMRLEDAKRLVDALAKLLK